MKSLSKYTKLLLEMNLFQTFRLYLRVRKPRSASIRVLNKSVIAIDRCSRITLEEKAWLEINRQYYHFDSGKRCRLELMRNAHLHILGGCQILNESSLLIRPNAELTIGNQTYLNGCRIDCSQSISIGNNCAIAEGVCILDNACHSLLNEENTKKCIAPVKIGNNVWIATNAMILPGVTIEDGSVVAAGAVVTKDVPVGCMVAGAPAKIIRENVKWQ